MKDFQAGSNCIISSQNVTIGDNVQIGHGCIIENDVFIGNNVKLGHKVTLKAGTHMCDGSSLADHCITTGACWIGKNATARTGAIISKSNVIEDYVFIGPGVVSNHTKHVVHGRDAVPHEQLLTYIGYGSIIGSQTSLLAGLTIAPLTVIGGGATVVKDCKTSGVYMGSPCKRVMNLPEMYEMNLPPDAGSMYMTEEVIEHLKSFLPNLKV